MYPAPVYNLLSTRHSGDHNGIIISASHSHGLWSGRVSHKQLPLHCGDINYILWKSRHILVAITPLLTRDLKTVVVVYVVCMLCRLWHTLTSLILNVSTIDWLHPGQWLGISKLQKILLNSNHSNVSNKFLCKLKKALLHGIILQATYNSLLHIGLCNPVYIRVLAAVPLVPVIITGLWAGCWLLASSHGAQAPGAGAVAG